MIRSWTAAFPALLWGVSALAYPGGTPHYVTDLVPACASCHSVYSAATMPEMPVARAAAELVENKHLGAILSGAFPLYSELDDDRKERLVAEVRGFDADARVRLEADATVPAGEVLEVKVRYTGGNGPVVGVMLVDRALRYQARPVQAVGWQVVGVQASTGDGKNAADWFGKRHGEKDATLSYVLLPARWSVGSDVPSGTVTFRLRAPGMPGQYPVVAAFLFGTENTDRAGFFQRPSGRILFSKPTTVSVD